MKPNKRGVTDNGGGLLPLFDSIAQAAAATGIPVAVLRLAKRQGCPAFRGSRVDVLAFTRWWFNRDGGEEQPTLQAKDRYELAHAQREELKLARERARLVDRGEVVDAIARATAAMFGELDRVFCSQFPAAAKGQTEEEIRDAAEAAIAAVQEGMKQRLQQLDENE